jgi:hypothetical protein
VPSLASKSCSTPGCRNRANGARCNACERNHRGTTTERGYSYKHQKLRIVAFERDDWTCVDCGWKPQILVACTEYRIDPPNTDIILAELRLAYIRGERHLHADHIVPLEVRPALAHELSNYATRCNECHDIKTKRER